MTNSSKLFSSKKNVVKGNSSSLLKGINCGSLAKPNINFEKSDLNKNSSILLPNKYISENEYNYLVNYNALYSLNDDKKVVEKRPRNYKTTHKGILRDPESVELIPEDENNKALIPFSLDYLKDFYLENDYIIEELKFKGKATTYKSSDISRSLHTLLNEDAGLGVVNSEEDILYDYTTVTIVVYPKDKNKFSGTIISELDRVWAGFLSPNAVREIVREKHCYMYSVMKKIIVDGVSIENDDGSIFTYGHKYFNPSRYNDLNVPNNTLYLDLFTQTTKGTIDYLTNKGYNINNKLGYGISGGGAHLRTYINIAHPIVNYFDGYLIHGQPDGGNEIYENTLPIIFYITRIDLNVPVFTLNEENDFYNRFEGGFTPEIYDTYASIPTNPLNKTPLVHWLNTGTDHGSSEFYYKTINNETYENIAYNALSNNKEDTIYGTKRDDNTYANDGPESLIFKSALNKLVLWSKYGIEPKQSPIYEYENIDNKVVLLKDKLGFTKGGIRTALIRVPLRLFQGRDTIPIEKEVLQSLYSSVDDFVEKFTKAINEDVINGWILEVDKQYTIDEQTEIAKILLA